MRGSTVKDTALLISKKRMKSFRWCIKLSLGGKANIYYNITGS